MTHSGFAKCDSRYDVNYLVTESPYNEMGFIHLCVQNAPYIINNIQTWIITRSVQSSLLVKLLKLLTFSVNIFCILVAVRGVVSCCWKTLCLFGVQVFVKFSVISERINASFSSFSST